MSLRRIQTVHRAAKPNKCSRCGDVIAKGDPYIYYEMGFRPSFKISRCTKPACYPKPSERETSNVALAYEAQETADADFDAATEPPWGEWQQGVDDVTTIVTQAGESIQEVADTYREADEAFGGTGATESAERADTLESAADDLGSWSASSEAPDACGDHEGKEGIEDGLDPDCEDCQQAAATWWTDLVQEARDAVSGVELP